MSRTREVPTAADRPEDQGVTLVYSWEVEPGREAEFEELTHEIADVAAGFCGHEGIVWLRPHRGQRLYRGVLRFSGQDRLDAWLRLPERRAWLEHMRAVGHQVSHVQRQPTGMETWFSLPQRPVDAPPRWKMTLMTMLGAYPIPRHQLADHPAHRALPVPLKALLFPLLIAPLLIAPLLTYLVMPGLSRLFRRWLYGEEPRSEVK
ncbi:antibiotic biosynthesis monooxygenase [Streptomyces acidicola]|uniref:antibiotic biosynthesis monooxygenase n=1 Tax=Streptomyces acidicola TaxID=2596892 RepID=UPI003827E235